MTHYLKIVSVIAIFFCLSNTAFSQGNTCADAIPISALPYDDSGSICGTGNDYSVDEGANPSACSGQNAYLGGGEDMVFALTAPYNGCLTVDLDDADDAGLHIFAGCPDDPTTANCLGFDVTSSTAFGGVVNAIVNFQVNQGDTYYIVISTDNGCVNGFSLNMDGVESTLLNDYCENAIPLTGSGTNYGATNCGEPDSFTPDANGQSCIWQLNSWLTNENGVWYTFTVDGSTPQPITLEIENVVCDDTGGSLMQMGIWSDNGECTLGSDNFINCDIGITTVGIPNMTLPLGDYYVFVDGSAGANCEWEFVSEEIVNPEPDCTGPAGFIGN